MLMYVPALKRGIGRIPGFRAAWNTCLRGRLRKKYKRDFQSFAILSKAAGRNAPLWEDRYPFLSDATPRTNYNRHYIFHTAWAARMLARIKPERHVDISSSLFFVSIVSAFVPLVHYDYRPPDLKLDNLDTGFADLLRLPFPDGSVSSLSCMHVVEHVGLGRYGDPLDPEGDTKAMIELRRVIAPGGNLFFVVPVGRPRVCFNAHRIYSFEQIRDRFSDLTLREFRLVPDEASEGGLVEATPQQVSTQTYGCGCFWFQRPYTFKQ